MRHKIVFLLLAMLALLAEPRAETLCRGIGYDGDIPMQTLPGQPKYSTLWGDSTFPSVRVTPGYGAVAWWYSSDGFDWTLNWAFCTKDKCADQTMVADITNALASSDRLAAINAVMAKHHSLSANSVALLTWCPHWAEIKASRPTPPVYVVAKNGTSTTRPAYPYTPATATTPASRDTKSTARATVTATCDCKVRMFEGSTLYCAVDQARSLVAVCRKL